MPARGIWFLSLNRNGKIDRTERRPDDTKRISAAELPRGNGELILVVDDEPAIREMVSSGFTSRCYRVIAAANGADAVTAFERQSREVHLVLLDTDMPVLDGKATIPLIRALAPATPIVLMSGQVTADSNADTTARLAKPFQLEELLRTITSLVAR